MFGLRLTVIWIAVSRKLTAIQNGEKSPFYKSNCDKPLVALLLTMPLLRLVVSPVAKQLS